MVTAQEIFTAITEVLLIWTSQTLMTLVAGAASAALGAWPCCSMFSALAGKVGSSACPAAPTHLKTANQDAPGGPLCQHLSSISSRPVAWSEHTTSEGLELGQGKPSWSLLPSHVRQFMWKHACFSVSWGWFLQSLPLPINLRCYSWPPTHRYFPLVLLAKANSPASLKVQCLIWRHRVWTNLLLSLRSSSINTGTHYSNALKTQIPAKDGLSFALWTQ